MIKFICNRCKQEIKDVGFFCEISVTEVSSVLSPVKQIKGLGLQQKETRKYHLCKECFSVVEKQLDKVK